MKHKSYFMILLLFATTINIQLLAQSSEKNLTKYWNYQNRLKYFVNPTSSNTLYNHGEGLIMSTRNLISFSNCL